MTLERQAVLALTHRAQDAQISQVTMQVQVHRDEDHHDLHPI